MSTSRAVTDLDSIRDGHVENPGYISGVVIESSGDESELDLDVGDVYAEDYLPEAMRWSYEYVDVDLDPDDEKLVSSSIGQSKSISKQKRVILKWLKYTGLYGRNNYRICGTGEVGTSAGGKCGTLNIWTHNCSNLECMMPLHSLNHCKDKRCPVCYPVLLKRKQKQISARLLCRKALARNRSRNRKAVLGEMFVTWNSAEDIGSIAEFKMNVNDAIKYAKNYGWRGGVAVIHPFRVTEEAKIHAKEAGMSHWAWIREQDSPTDYYVFSPHIHLIGYFYHMRVQVRGGKYHYQTLTDARNRPVDYLKNENPNSAIMQRAGYLLSHTGYYRTNDGGGNIPEYVWAGNCSTGSFKTSVEELQSSLLIPKCCPICGAKVVSSWEACRLYYANEEAGYDPPKYLVCKGGDWSHNDAEILMVEFEK